MGVGAGLYMYVVVVQKFTFAISSPDEFLYTSVVSLSWNLDIIKSNTDDFSSCLVTCFVLFSTFGKRDQARQNDTKIA